jgi:lipopolysaccharide assembly outer membrane protein LptD (OstA)
MDGTPKLSSILKRRWLAIENFEWSIVVKAFRGCADADNKQYSRLWLRMSWVELHQAA